MFGFLGTTAFPSTPPPSKQRSMMMATETEKGETSSTQKLTQSQTRARSTGSVSTGTGSGTGTFSVDEVALLNQFLSPNSGSSGSGSNSGEKNTAVWEVAYTASQSVDGQSSVDGLGGGTLTSTRYKICTTNMKCTLLLYITELYY